MSQAESMHIVTVGMSPALVRDLWDRVQLKVDFRISHIAHPSFDPDSWGAVNPVRDVSFFRDQPRIKMPAPDRELLASLGTAGVPTIHNMIMGDHIVSKLPYEESLAYATFLARQLMTFYSSMKPTGIIGGFDALHGSLGFAVARLMGIPWFALNFNSLPSRLVSLCSDLTPASHVILESGRAQKMRAVADRVLKEFEVRKIEAVAYIPPKVLSPAFLIKRIPAQLRTLVKIARRRAAKDVYKYSEFASAYSLYGLFKEAIRLRKNVLRLPHGELLRVPPSGRYAFFGLHMQPESSIDVFAHFFSNQTHVVELMARSLPPTHMLLVKLHKSDVPNYSRALLSKLAAFPGVRLVSPYADTFEFIKRSDLILSIQGTIGLEGALLGKPVIMFGDSPTKIFPGVSTIGRTPDLPALVRQKLGEKAAGRNAIVDAFATYLAPFYPASGNDWTVRPTDDEIDGYVHLFALLDKYLRSDARIDARRALFSS
jgi:hypothetical protein